MWQIAVTVYKEAGHMLAAAACLANWCEKKKSRRKKKKEGKEKKKKRNSCNCPVVVTGRGTS